MATLVAKSLQRFSCAIEQTSPRVNQCKVNINENIRVFHGARCGLKFNIRTAGPYLEIIPPFQEIKSKSTTGLDSLPTGLSNLTAQFKVAVGNSVMRF